MFYFSSPENELEPYNTVTVEQKFANVNEIRFGGVIIYKNQLSSELCTNRTSSTLTA